MPAVMNRSEYVQERHHGHGRVDREAGVLRNVLVARAGKSANGYTYESDALRNAVKLYERAPVFWNHGKTASRDLSDKVGWLEGVRLEGTAIRADLHVIKSHPRAETIFEGASRNPGHFGLSHVARVTWADSGKTRVRSIDAVRSVDLVDTPALTSNLWESRQPLTKEAVVRRWGGTVREEQMGMDEPVSDEPAATPAAAVPEVEALAGRIADIAKNVNMPRKERDKKIAELLDLLDSMQDTLQNATESDRRRIMGLIREVHANHRAPSNSHDARHRWGGRRSA